MVARHLVTLVPWFVAIALPMVAAQDTGHTPPSAPSFEKAPCPVMGDAKTMEQVRCGYVTVPENRAAPGARRLRLAVAIMKSLAATPLPDPIVVIHGGPGGRAVDLVPGYVRNGTMDAVRVDRDVIVYDQRGVGYSEPSFCPEASAAMAAAATGAGEVKGPADYRAFQRQQLARCGEYMRAAGYDLSQYNSVAGAHDLDDLRRALGYERWNLRAASYGTRLALAAMRVAPQALRSVVLDGPSAPTRATWFNKPADFVDILGRLSAACAAQPSCKEAFPDVERTFWRAVEQAEQSPKPRPVILPNGTSATIVIDGSTVTGAISNLLDRGMFRVVPVAIHALASGNEAVLETLTKMLTSRSDGGVTGLGFGWGLSYTVNCFEEAPLNTAELRQRMRRSHPAILSDGAVFPDPTVCEGIHPFRAGPEYAVPTESDVPTLIFVGEFDSRTHKSNGQIVGQSLKRSQLVEIPGAGHVQSWTHECTRTMMRNFYNAPLQPVETSCLTSIPELRFVTDLKAIAR